MDTTPENYRKGRTAKARLRSQAEVDADAALPDGGWRPLTRWQKARLAMTARKAYDRLKVQGMTLDEWRQEIAIRACGRRVSEACQCHWAELMAAFLNLNGASDKALNVLLREGDNKRRVAMHKLTQELAKKGLEVGYAAAICSKQFKCALADASAKQIWCLFFTVKNRRN